MTLESINFLIRALPFLDRELSTDIIFNCEKLSVADKKVEGPSPSLQESKKIRAVHSIAVDVIANKIETNFLKPNLEEQPCSSTVLSVEMCESKKDSKLPEKNVALKMLEPSSVKLSNTLTKDDKIANPEVFENLENNQTSISSEIRTPRNNDSLVPQKENARIIAAERSKIVGKNDAIPELKDIQTSVFLGKEKIPCVSRTFEKYSDVILAPQISQERSHMDTPSSTNGKELEVSESISSKGSPVAGDNDKPKNTSFKVVEKGNKSALKDHVNLQKNVQKIKSKEMPGSEIRSEIPESGNDSKNLDQNPPKEEQIKNGADELEKDIIPSISQSKFYFQNMSEKEKRSTESIESISLSSPTNNSNIVGLSNEKSGISISEIDPNIIETVEGAIQKLDLSKKTVRDDLSESLSQSIFESGTKSLEECKTIVDTFLNHENDPGFGKEVKNNEIFAVSHPDMNTNKLFSSFDKEKKNQFNKENIKLSCETASEVASSLVAESSPVNNDIDSTSSTVHSASENLFLTPAEEAKDFNIENVEAFSNESAKKIPINNFDLPNDEKLTNILIDMLIEQETAKLVASGDISDNDSDDLSETKNENSLKNDYGVDTIIGLSPKNNIPSGSQKYGHAKEKSKTPNLKLNDITEESISLSYDSSFKDYDDLFSNTEIIDDPQLIKNLISDPTSITSISSFTESVSHEKGKLPKPIITTPTLSRRGVGGSQRLARADRPELREIHLRASEEVYSSDDNETYIVEEPLPKRKVKFQLDSTDSSSREKDDDRGDVEIEEISDEEGVDSTEQVLIEPVPENFKERKLRRVEKKFERMASQTLEENKDNGPGVDREFQRMVSQLSNEEVDECLQLWDDGAFTPSDDLVSKETPDEELGEFESLPHEGNISVPVMVCLIHRALVRQSSASPSMSVASSVLSIQQEILNELTKGTNDVPASIYWSFDTTPTPTPHAIDKNKLNPQQSLSPVIHPIREPCSVNDSPLGYNYRNSALNEESDQQGLKSRGDESKNVEAKPRKLKYDISMDEEIEVDPREHDWRFNLNLPPYSEKEETSGAAASEQSQPSDSRSGGNN